MRAAILDGMSRSQVWVGRVFAVVWCFALCLGSALHDHDSGVEKLIVPGYLVLGLAMGALARIDARRGRDASAVLARAWVLGVFGAVAGGLSALDDATFSVVPAAVAAMVAGAECALAQAAAVAAVAVLSTLMAAIIAGTAQLPLLIGLPATIVSGLFLGRHLRASQERASQAVELLERTRELQVQQRRADVLDERTRIAREIHDVLAHSLGSLSIQIQAARAVLADGGDVAMVLDVLADAQRLATGGLAETRRALHALRADSFSVEGELRTLAADHTGLHAAAVTVGIEGEQGELDPAAAMTLLRVAQEALVNAAKHAPGRPVGLRLEYGEEQVRLSVRNALGAAADARAGTLSTADSGFGLAGMRERLLLAGGGLEAGARGDEWIVEAVLPAAGSEVAAGSGSEAAAGSAAGARPAEGARA